MFASPYEVAGESAYAKPHAIQPHNQQADRYEYEACADQKPPHSFIILLRPSLQIARSVCGSSGLGHTILSGATYRRPAICSSNRIAVTEIA